VVVVVVVVVVVGNARLFNGTHELLSRAWTGTHCLMLKIKHNVVLCNVQRGAVKRHVVVIILV